MLLSGMQLEESRSFVYRGGICWSGESADERRPVSSKLLPEWVEITNGVPKLTGGIGIPRQREPGGGGGSEMLEPERCFIEVNPTLNLALNPTLTLTLNPTILEASHLQAECFTSGSTGAEMFRGRTQTGCYPRLLPATSTSCSAHEPSRDSERVSAPPRTRSSHGGKRRRRGADLL